MSRKMELEEMQRYISTQDDQKYCMASAPVLLDQGGPFCLKGRWTGLGRGLQSHQEIHGFPQALGEGMLWDLHERGACVLLGQQPKDTEQLNK